MHDNKVGQEEFKIPLTELASPQDLEIRLNTFLDRAISETVGREKRRLDSKVAQEKILKIAHDLQIPAYLSALNKGFTGWKQPVLQILNTPEGQKEAIERYQGKLDDYDYLDIPSELVGWLNNEPGLVYTVWARGDEKTEGYFFVAVNYSGRVGILQKDKTIVTMQKDEAPSGGGGFDSRAQINPILNKAINEASKNPPVTTKTKYPSTYTSSQH